MVEPAEGWLQPRRAAAMGSRATTLALFVLQGLAGLAHAATPGAPPLDTLVFGDRASAAAHGLELRNAARLETANETVGEVAAVHIADAKPGGSVLFTMAVDPRRRNHLTVKFWGGALASVPQVHRDTWLLDPAKNFTAQHGSSSNFPCEFDGVHPVSGVAAQGPLPGRWQYITYALPPEWTLLRKELRLGLGTGNFIGYGPPTYMPSRSFFRAYTHTAPYLSLPATEQQGTVPSLADPRPPAANFSDEVGAQVAAGVQHLLDQQLMNWSAVADGTMPSAIYGAPTLGFLCPGAPGSENNKKHPPKKPAVYNRSECKNAYQSRDDSGNLPWSTSLMIVAEAFASNASWATKFAGKPEVLWRVALALDVHVRAQGSNGGFRRDGGPAPIWAGGPHRHDADNPLEGWAHASLARSFLLTRVAMETGGLLAQTMDDDDDPATPNITRKAAYTQLFKGSLSYLNSTGQTLCPNQEQGDAKALFGANTALSFLQPELAWSEERMLELVVRPALGFANFTPAMWRGYSKWHQQSKMPEGNWVTTSPTGISMEALGSYAGGYSQGYGDAMGGIDEFARWALQAGQHATYALIASMLRPMTESFGQFRRMENCADEAGSYRCLRNEGFATWRNNMNPAGPRELFSDGHFAVHAATVLRIPVYIRELQMAMGMAGAPNQYFNCMDPSIDKKRSDECGSHFVDMLRGSIPFAEGLSSLAELPKETTAKLPFENSTASAWADPMARAVVARVGDQVLTAVLQYRHDTPANGGKPWRNGAVARLKPNNICRVELNEQGGAVDRLASVACGQHGEGLFGIQSLAFGDFAIGMNSNLYQSGVWLVPKDYVGIPAIELISGRKVASLPETWKLAPNMTAVVFVGNTTSRRNARLKTDEATALRSVAPASLLSPQPAPCTTQGCVGAPVPKGCVHDGAASRQMNSANFTDRTGMTQTACFTFCRGFDPPYPIAGVENSNQCFCGERLPAPPATGRPRPWCAAPDGSGTAAAAAAAAQKCNATLPCHSHGDEYCCCPGDANSTCGGTGILQLFDVSQLSCGSRPMTQPWCDEAAPQRQRVAALIKAMTPAERVDTLGTKTMGAPRLGVSMQFKEALHGLRFPCVYDVPSRKGKGMCPTSFPHAQLLAATFNRSLWSAVGDRISTEARAWHNVWQDGKSQTMGAFHALSFFAPDINLCRDPRWGRCLEVPSECPLLTGEYAMSFVHAMQQKSTDGKYFKVLANAKHFSSYDVEKGSDNSPGQTGGGAEYDRGSFNAHTSRQDMIETYWPQFRAAVQGADLAGTMCSYNAVCVEGVNGGQCVPSCANGIFNNEVLRQKFGFTGMIVSDCGAINQIGHSHNYSSNEAKAGLRGGCDVDCGTAYAASVPAALKDGSIVEQDVVRALDRTLSQLVSLGLANAKPPAPWASLDERDVDTAEHRKLAKDAAMQGFVLLKNEEKALPLLQQRSAGGKLKVAVLGPHFNSSTHLLANYYGGNDLVKTQTPLMGLRRRPELDIVSAAEGVPMCGTFCAPGDIPAAVAAAKTADVALLFVGLHSTQGKGSTAANMSDDVPGVNNGPGMEREGYDRTKLTLPDGQVRLIKAVSAAGVKTVVVLINGGGVACEAWLADASAVLEAYYPGEMGGDAMAAVLLGDVSPSGRLTTTVYPAEFIHTRNITDMVLRPHGAIPGITYRFMDPLASTSAMPIFEFGFGKSYTSFTFSWAAAREKTTEAKDVAADFAMYFSSRGAAPPSVAAPLTYSVSVKNTGAVTSDVVVLCFVAQLNNTDGPRRQLAGFERVSRLAPGAAKDVNIGLAPTALVTVTNAGSEMVQAGTWSVQCGGAPDGFAQGTLEITGEAVETFALPTEDEGVFVLAWAHTGHERGFYPLQPDFTVDHTLLSLPSDATKFWVWRVIPTIL